MGTELILDFFKEYGLNLSLIASLELNVSSKSILPTISRIVVIARYSIPFFKL